jgi:hypothetical protein
VVSATDINYDIQILIVVMNNSYYDSQYLLSKLKETL